MKNGNKKHFDVFVSYRRDIGFGIARSIYAELVFRGYRVFMDTEQLGSCRYDEELLKRIARAKDVIFVLTPGALDIRDGENPEDDWLRKEIKAVLSAPNRPNILPVADVNFKWPDTTVLKASKIERGIDVSELKLYEVETFVPTAFSHLIDMLSGKDRKKNFCLRALPVIAYWSRLGWAIAAALLMLGVLWGAANQVRAIGKIFRLRHDPVILVGSGTVSNYLRGQGVENGDRDVAILDAPTDYALKLLREAKNSERGNCYVMFMAAKQMDCESLKDNNIDMSGLSIVEVNLRASDKLQVILKPFSAFGAYVAANAECIRVDSVVKILKDFQSRDNTFIYRTSTKSGTFSLFRDEFAKWGYELPEASNIAEFYEANKGRNLHMTRNEISIVLCGELYKPAASEYACRGVEGRLLDVVDGEGVKIGKPMYLYFVVSEEDPSIPDAIKEFLHNIHKDNVLSNLNTRNLDNGIIYRDF